jgi:hypothetical protein
MVPVIDAIAAVSNAFRDQEAILRRAKAIFRLESSGAIPAKQAGFAGNG